MTLDFSFVQNGLYIQRSKVFITPKMEHTIQYLLICLRQCLDFIVLICVELNARWTIRVLVLQKHCCYAN